MGLNVKADSVEVNEQSSGLLPKGKYCAIVHSIKDEENIVAKSSGAKYSRLNIRFEITKGEFAGRSLWKSVIYDHETSPVAANIGLEFLKRLFVAGKCEGDEISVPALEASTEIQLSVVVQEGSGGYGDRNEINFVDRCSPDSCGKDCSATCEQEGTAEGW